MAEEKKAKSQNITTDFSFSFFSVFLDFFILFLEA